MPQYELPGDPDTINKNNNPVSPGTPSTPPGPGGGFGGGFGSFFGNGFGAYGGGDQLNGMPRKLGMGAMQGGRMNGPMTHGVAGMVNNGGPQSMVAGALHAAYGGAINGPGSGTSDSIPAKLSNGEFVVRAEVAQQPGVKEFLHLLNAGHFHDDVPGMQDPQHVENNIQHFANGGWVGSLVGRIPGHNPNGSLIGANAPTGGFQSSNPWGAYTGDQRGDMNGALNRMFGAAGQAGVFDPNGSSALTNQLRQHAMMDAGAQESGLVNQARMQFGDDPQMAGYAALQGRMAGQHNTAQALADASTRSAFQNQGFLQNLTAGTMGNSQQAQQQQWMNNHQQSTSPSLGSTLGGIAGTLGGAFLGGPAGAAIGGRLFGGGGGSGYLGQGGSGSTVGGNFGAGGGWGGNPMPQGWQY